MNKFEALGFDMEAVFVTGMQDALDSGQMETVTNEGKTRVFIRRDVGNGIFLQYQLKQEEGEVSEEKTFSLADCFPGFLSEEVYDVKFIDHADGCFNVSIGGPMVIFKVLNAHYYILNPPLLNFSEDRAMKVHLCGIAVHCQIYEPREDKREFTKDGETFSVDFGFGGHLLPSSISGGEEETDAYCDVAGKILAVNNVINPCTQKPLYHLFVDTFAGESSVFEIVVPEDKTQPAPLPGFYFSGTVWFQGDVIA